MTKHVDHRLHRTPPEKPEITLRNQIRRDVVAAFHLQHLGFEFHQADRTQAQPPDLPGRMEQVEMRQRLGKRGGPGHSVAGFDQWPIETLAVECHQDGALTQPFRQG
jgi:hypothetical protein